jgi:hypothetical protein
VGKIKFLLNKNDQEEYVYIVSTSLLPEIIMKDNFTNNEYRILLRTGCSLTMIMKIPNVEYIVIHPFEALKKKDYFSS